MQLDFIMNSLGLIETLTSKYSMKTLAQVSIDFDNFQVIATSIFLSLFNLFFMQCECTPFLVPVDDFPFQEQRKIFTSTGDRQLTHFLRHMIMEVWCITEVKHSARMESQR